MAQSDTREQIVEVADRLFYQQGYEHTSFAHIAAEVKISRGNFYHHFRSKDEILDAVISHRIERTREMLAQWEKQGQTPADRLRSFVHILIANRAKIKRYGCPVGSLCTELTKLGHASRSEAGKLFTLFRDWLRTQFIACGREQDADDLAMHLLAMSQGAATLAQAFNDQDFLAAEEIRINHWLDAVLAENTPVR